MASVSICITGQRAGEFIAAVCPVVVTDPAGTPMSGRITLARGLALHVTRDVCAPADAHLHVLSDDQDTSDSDADASVWLDGGVGDSHVVETEHPLTLRIDPAQRSHLAAALIAGLTARLETSVV